METEVWSGFTIPCDTPDRLKSILSILSITGVVYVRKDYDDIYKSKELFDVMRLVSNMNNTIEFFEQGIEGIAIYTKKIPAITM